MTLAEKVKQAGVVGAGGAGFPSHVKLVADAEWYLANGAECEPLICKDRELMTRYPDEIVKGLQLAASAVGADRMAIGVKGKNKDAIDALKSAVSGTEVRIHEFGDFYPSGDEYEVVHTITGQLIPAGGIPLEIGVVVNNVETLYQIYQASQDLPVTETFLTIAGEVGTPLTTWVPVGMRISDVLELAGGSSVSDFAVMESGLMMGRLVDDLSQPVTKTTAGLIVLPANHDLVRRYRKPAEAMSRIGKSACDQCSYCTELCPRYLLGYDVQPHAVMRSLGFTLTGSRLWNEYALLCCGCGICTLYACPESLYPREACLQAIEDLRTVGKKWDGSRDVRVHPMKEFRRVPMRQLVRRLGVDHLQSKAPWQDLSVDPDVVVLTLTQQAGHRVVPVVALSETVTKGQLVARVEEGKLGAHLHASISGRVTAIDEAIRIEKR